MRTTIVMISLPSLTQATLEFSVWICGRSSGVERNLAKVDVVSSNLIARSIYGAYLNLYYRLEHGRFGFAHMQSRYTKEIFFGRMTGESSFWQLSNLLAT